MSPSLRSKPAGRLLTTGPDAVNKRAEFARLHRFSGARVTHSTLPGSRTPLFLWNSGDNATSPTR